MINKIQEHNMMHALGWPRLHKNWKAKTILKKCYRNRFCISDDESWNDLVYKKFAIKKQSEDSFYYVTRKGVDYLRAFRNELKR